MNLINRSAVKKLCKEYSEDFRNGRFTRVSDEFLTQLEALVKLTVADSVKNHPSTGKTITELRRGTR